MPPIVLADSTVDPHLQRCSLGTISGQSHKAIFLGWYRDGWGWSQIRLFFSSYPCGVLDGSCYHLTCFVDVVTAFTTASILSFHMVFINTKDVSGHETLVFARWNSISKFCLSVSGTPNDAVNSHWKRHAKCWILWRCNGHGWGVSKKDTCSIRYADRYDMVVKVFNEEWLEFSMFYCWLYPWKLWDLETNKLRETRNRQKRGSLMITPNYETGVEWRQIASPANMLVRTDIWIPFNSREQPPPPGSKI